MTSHPTPTAQADLPPLPEPEVSWVDGKDQWGYDAYSSAFSADQMRSYAAEALAADRSRASRAAGAVWQPLDSMPTGGAFMVKNALGEVAPRIDGVIHNCIGTEHDWTFGEPITGWMPFPAAAPGAPSAPERQTEVADGWVMVPRVPTEAMLEAGAIYRRDVEVSGKNLKSSGLYEAMLAAAPSAPSREAEADERPAWYGVQDEVALTRAVHVMNDVLGDISGWEDKALAAAVESSKVDLMAMIECIRMNADDTYVPGSKPIDGETFGAPVVAQAVRSVREAGE